MSYMDVMNGFGSQWTNAQAPPSYTPTYSPQALGQQNQSWLDNLYGGGANGGFGAQTNYYSGLGAAYGRATGGFGGYSAPQAAPAGADSGIASWGSQPMVDPYMAKWLQSNSPSFDNRWSVVPSYVDQSPDAGLPSQFGERDWLHPYQVPKAAPPPAWTPTPSAPQGLPYRSPFSSGRADLARILMESNSPKAPAVTPPSPSHLYTGNWFGAGTNPAAGMAPGMGGFNNPNYNSMDFAPPNQPSMSPTTAQDWERLYGRAGGSS